MINDIEKRIKIYQVLENQIPEFILDESPKFSEFLKQYYISQEFAGGPVNIAENLDQYLKLDNLIPEVIVGETTLLNDIDDNDTVIVVESTKGYPDKYGLLKIDDEIITYTSKTSTTFNGCIRGFSGITNYHKELNYEELVFSDTNSSPHTKDSKVTNLSSLFFQELYKKIKYTLTPGLENYDFDSDLNIGNFIKESRSLYNSKGTEESFRILFNVLYGITPKIIDLENFLLKPSHANFLRRDVIIIEVKEGNPIFLKGQTIFKENDTSTTASVSEVEVLTRKGKTYYKLLIFVGYDDTSTNITGKFGITPNTKILENVSIGSSIISVDSTIGFSESGSIYVDDHKINYSEKSINQFYGCYTDNYSTIQIELAAKKIVRTDDLYYGYENGDENKRVEFKITGTLNKLNITSDFNSFYEGDEIYIKNLGEKIENPTLGKNKKEIIANSFIYNTSSKYEVDSINTLQSKVDIKDNIDKSSLKVGDYVEFLQRETQLVEPLYSNCKVTDILENTVFFDETPLTNLNPNKLYDIRRKLNKSISSIVPIKFGNSNLISDIQNVYNENNENLYVTSNSLPSYDIDLDIFKYDVKNILIDSYNSDTRKYSILEFDNEISFITGNEIYYTFTDENIEDLESGKYYVEVLSNKKQIRLYTSLSFIGTNDFVEFGTSDGILPSGTHTFILYSQKENLITPQKLLRKIKIHPRVDQNTYNENENEEIGILVNGVEVLNYKSTDKIYYGPIKSIDILSGGNGYDVINPPLVTTSSGNAKVQPVITGSVEKIYFDPRDYDVDVIINVSLQGGNGSGAIFEPIIERKRREIEFDSRQLFQGGGVDIDFETITFTTKHNLQNGEPIIYDSNGNTPIGISSNNNISNIDQNTFLINGSSYYPEIVNDKTVQLYQNFNDYSSGINTIRFTDVFNAGIHKFKTKIRNTLREIKVVNSGSGYTNRKLIVNSSGISTFNNSINFNNHGFGDGELIKYEYTNTPISGIVTTNQFYVLKIDDNSFRICDAGFNGKDKSNYDRKKYLKFSNVGSGQHIFKYPEIKLDVTYTLSGIGSTAISGVIDSTPIVRGKITQLYIYNEGSDYGSNILNLHKKPSILIKNGSSAEFNPIISNGRIVDVIVEYGGIDYYSTPDIKVVGSGRGALLYPILKNNKIVKIVVINSGIDYDKNKTTIIAVPAGSGATFNPKVRDLTVNSLYKYGIQRSEVYREPASEILYSSLNGLKYSIFSYSQKIKNYFNDHSVSHSPIIGWAYDGNPIYGPYGYSIPNDENSEIKLLESGYVETEIENRPSSSVFPKGFFIEDYSYKNSGDLDIHNGRYCKTPEFPNGTYAYFATVSSDVEDSPEGTFVGKFPYFVGETFRSEFIEENKFLNQSFDFNNSNLIRNTFPYRLNEKYSDNDFIIESNELIDQKILVESVTTGKIDGFDIVDSGENYSVGDSLTFESNDDYGSGLRAKVSEIKGKEILSINTNIDVYNNVNVIWDGKEKLKFVVLPSHSLQSGDYVNVYGLDENLSELNGFYQVGVSTYSSVLLKTIPQYSFGGITTDIVVSNIPNEIYVDSLLKIENETFKVLNVYQKLNTIKVLRQSGGPQHSKQVEVKFIPTTFTINKKIDYFGSNLTKKNYFNPSSSVGVGTTGQLKEYYVSGTKYTNFVPSQSIFIPDHNFQTNEKVSIGRSTTDAPSPSNLIEVSYEPNGTTFNILTTESQDFYIINKSKDYVGIVTNVGLTTTSNGLYFRSSTPNNDLYTIKSYNSQVSANVRRINSLISVSTSHNLSVNDIINLKLKSNLSVGIGTTTVKVKYDSKTNNIILDYLKFNSSNVNTTTNSITVNSHKLISGDKVYYDSKGGISTGFYYVYRVDDDVIKLSETKFDSLQIPPSTININQSGGSNQTLDLVNPQIRVIKNNNLVFDLSDQSLLGYNFKIYYDSNFNNEFLSTKDGPEFNIETSGTIGISTSLLTVNYSNNLPDKLYYTLEKDGVIINSDKDVNNYSQISYENSGYDGKYSVYGIGSTSFNVSLKNVPEKLNYSKKECSVLEYTTNSKTAIGGISNVKILNNGSGYKSLPVFSGSNSKKGIGVYIIPKSKEIGKIKSTRIVNEGFEYSVDRTLRPNAFISSQIKIKSSNIVDSIEILNNGKNYLRKPDLIFIDSKSREIIESGYVEANLSGTIISSVDILEIPRGLPSGEIEIKSINNTNGIDVKKVESVLGIVTCTLVTPINGFAFEPFKVGDKIFVENIEKIGEEGTGFNSKDYGYQFFTITSYNPLNNPRELTYSLSGLTTNPGIAKTTQTNFPSIVNYNNYPSFKVNTKFSPFFLGETISSDLGDGSGFNSRDLIVKKSNENYLNLLGTYNLSPEEVIIGDESKNVAFVEEVRVIDGRFDVDYSFRKDYGWENDYGKLNSENQVIPDNDYYQNLSYTVKSEKEWNDIVTPVNNVIHTSGLKNFADTEIVSDSGVAKTTTVLDSDVQLINNFINETRVDIINNFDLVLDKDVYLDKSKFLQFKNIKLSDYFLAKTNRVLDIDDISSKFSTSENSVLQYSNIFEINPAKIYDNFIIQIKDFTNSEVQFVELNTIVDGNNILTLQKGLLCNKENSIADIYGVYDDIEKRYYLKFDPVDILNRDYDIKILNSEFVTNDTISTTYPIGSINLIGISTVVNANNQINVVSLNISDFKSIYSSIQLIDAVTSKINYVDVYVTHDESNSYIAEYYADDEDGFSTSSQYLGNFSAQISSGKISLIYTNNNTKVLLRSKTIAFRKQVFATSNYRFKTNRQLPGTERTVVYDSYKTNVTGAAVTTIGTFSRSLFTSVKTYAEVSVGSTVALHQIMTVYDGSDVYNLQYPYLSIGSTTGLGTFGSEIQSTNFVLRFYPDSNISEEIKISILNQNFYSKIDTINKPNDLVYSPITESVLVSNFYGLNSDNINVTVFDLNYQKVPIFKKVFDPLDELTLNPSTGNFYIQNHFFSTGEQLIYRPKSTLIGIGESALVVSGGTTLPETVYAIKVDNDNFKLALTAPNAIAGTAVTFSSLGDGNAHELEMFKKNEKSIISLNGIIQYPLIYTKINHSLTKNITDQETILPLSGISTVTISNILKIDNEYMKVTNVGFGTTSLGPITFTGSIPLVEVERGVVGSSSTSHLNNSTAKVYRGSYNIVGSQVHFTDYPIGLSPFSLYNLPTVRASFTGRVFLRNNYSTNRIYDDVSTNFNGIGQTFPLTIEGNNTIGLGTVGGNGIVLINGIFQTPSTENNAGKNYGIVEDLINSNTKIVFTGIRDNDNNQFITELDVNQNQIPRGGIIISLGSTPGLGYAPLFGAKVKAVVNGSGNITNIIGIPTTGGSIPFSTVSYDNLSGVLKIFSTSLEKLDGIDQVKLVGLGFTCPSNPGIVSYFPRDNNPSNIIGIGNTYFSVQVGTSTLPHTYVGFGSIYSWYGDLSYGSGYKNPVSIGISELNHSGSNAVINAVVGLGGTLSFNIVNPGSGYTNPTINIPSPIYENLAVEGVSRLGIGTTTDTGVGLLLNVEIGASSTTGIGSTLFEVSSFKIARPGYSFQKGDVLRAVGLVTARGLSKPIEEFKLTVLETFTDSFAAWEFGELNYIDSISALQNGVRKRFPLFYNSELLSFEKSEDDPDSSLIDFDSLLVIFINGVIQKPKESYQFNGGTSFTFTQAPKAEDDIAIFFYIGTKDVDSVQITNITPVIEDGDTVQIYSDNNNLSNTVTQGKRIVAGITSSDTIETILYDGNGIDEVNYKPLYFTRKKDDNVINGSIVYKSRDSIEPQVYPTAKIIKNLTTTDTEVIVDDVSLFNYENDNPIDFDCLIVSGDKDPVSAAITAIVSPSGTIQTLNIESSGSGYTGNSIDVKISSPQNTNTGITATANVNVSREHGYSEWYCLDDGLVTYSILKSGVRIDEKQTNGTITNMVPTTTGPSRGTFDIIKGRTYYGVGGPINLVAEGQQHKIAPLTMAGKEFFWVAIRSNPGVVYLYSPFKNATVKFWDNPLGGSINTITPSKQFDLNVGIGTTFSFNTALDGEYVKQFYITSTEPILASTIQTGINFQPDGSDKTILSPASNYVYQRFISYYSTMVGILTVTGIYPSSITTGCVSDTTYKVMTHSIADGSGGDCCQGLGLEYLSDRYSWGNTLSDYVISCPYVGIITASYWNGSAWNILETHSIVGTSITNPINIRRSGNTGPGIAATDVGINGSASNFISNTTTLWKWEGTTPFYLAINDSVDDEFSVLGWTNNKGILTLPITMTNSGSGYTTSAPPQVIVPLPPPVYENVKKIDFIKSFKGTITGIQSTTGIGTSKAIRFTLAGSSDYTSLIGYPILIKNTRIGRGTTSIISNDSNVIGIGTTFLDNIYYVNAASSLGIITCNVSSGTNLNGISTTGTTISPVGQFSMGKISGVDFKRSSNPISLTVYGNSIDSELTNFPTIQRRRTGLRNIGPLKKDNV